MNLKVTKEVETYVTTDIDVEIETDDIDDDELLMVCIDRFSPLELAEAFDRKADSWEFTAKMRDFFVAEMEKHEVKV